METLKEDYYFPVPAALSDHNPRGIWVVLERPSSSERHAALSHPLMCIQGPPSANVTFPSYAIPGLQGAPGTFLRLILGR